MVLPLTYFGNPVLRHKGDPVSEITPELEQFIEDMFDTMEKHRGIGLASQQVGRAIQLTVIDIRPVEGLHKRLRQRQSRCFDDNMIRARGLRQKLLHARQKVIGNGTADTAIRQFDDVLGTAAVRATFFQHRTIHADVPEFIDNQRQPAAIRLHDDVANQRRFSGS